MFARAFLALSLVLIVLPSSASAQSFELETKTVKVGKNSAGVLPELELRPQKPTELIKEPKYRSSRPQKFVSRFGGESGISVTFAVDEKKGTGEGFDFLITDATGNGNLAKGKKVSGKIVARSRSYLDTVFPSLQVMIPVADGTRKYPVLPRFSTRRDAAEDSSLYLTPLCVMQGQVEFDGMRRTMIVFDANCNGVFGEKGSAAGRSSQGDRIWIGKGKPKIEKACVESLPIGKYFLFENQCFEITFDHGRMVEVVKADVPMGTVRVNNPGFLLELVQRDTVLYASNEKGTDVNIPAGTYRVNTAGFRRKYKGKTWELEGTPGACKASFTVTENEVTDITVGPPLKIVVTTRLRTVGTGLQASLDFSIAGSSGEKYSFLRRDGKKIDLPEISIRNKSNKEVQKGSFEYG